MKKAVKSKKRVSKSSRTRSKKSSFTFQRLVIITACALLVVGFFNLKKTSITQSVAGISIARGFFSEGTVEWDKDFSASSYNIYYRQKGEDKFTNAVRAIPSSVTSYTIYYLKKGTTYEYQISAADSGGREFTWSPILPLTNIKPM